ncbi:MAG: hypothetical protein ACI8RD_014321 [Bacillariaceae sp.]|jgi:hypothetical protein
MARRKEHFDNSYYGVKTFDRIYTVKEKQHMIE